MEVIINRRIGGFNLSEKAEELFYQVVKNNKTYGIDNFADFKSLIYYSVDSYKIRNNKELVRIVKELGEEANGWGCKLKIVNIPDDVDWIILEGDMGFEQVAEKFRTWE